MDLCACVRACVRAWCACGQRLFLIKCGTCVRLEGCLAVGLECSTPLSRLHHVMGLCSVEGKQTYPVDAGFCGSFIPSFLSLFSLGKQLYSGDRRRNSTDN